MHFCNFHLFVCVTRVLFIVPLGKCVINKKNYELNVQIFVLLPFIMKTMLYHALLVLIHRYIVRSFIAIFIFLVQCTLASHLMTNYCVHSSRHKRCPGHQSVYYCNSLQKNVFFIFCTFFQDYFSDIGNNFYCRIVLKLSKNEVGLHLKKCYRKKQKSCIDSILVSLLPFFNLII